MPETYITSVGYNFLKNNVDLFLFDLSVVFEILNGKFLVLKKIPDIYIPVNA